MYFSSWDTLSSADRWWCVVKQFTRKNCLWWKTPRAFGSHAKYALSTSCSMQMEFMRMFQVISSNRPADSEHEISRRPRCCTGLKYFPFLVGAGSVYTSPSVSDVEYSVIYVLYCFRKAKFRDETPKCCNQRQIMKRGWAVNHYPPYSVGPLSSYTRAALSSLENNSQ